MSQSSLGIEWDTSKKVGAMSAMSGTSSSLGGRGGILGGGGKGDGGTKTSEFSKCVRDLNVAFHHSVRNVVTKNPTHSLLPLVKDYLYHSRVLLEQCKRGSGPAELLNGMNSPPKSFKSLGEFFDDLEKRYIEQSDEMSVGGTSSAFKNSTYSSTMESSIKLNYMNSTFSLPIKPMDITKTTSLSAQAPSEPNTSLRSKRKFEDDDEPPNRKFSVVDSWAPVVEQTSSRSKRKFDDEDDDTCSHKFSIKTSPMMSASPLQSTTLMSSSPLSTISPLKSLSSDPAPFAPKPAAPFAGFSFLKGPSTSTFSTLGSITSTATTSPPTTTVNSDEKANDEDGDAEDEPPKVEITPVKEDDAVHSVRCKLFGVVDGKPKDKGIGMLYLKKLEDGRHQVVVRADNNLGTVILNILLQKSLPLQKNGKNAISTVDLQANNQKGMPIIIRVKTEDDADKLLAKMKEVQETS